MSNMPRAVERMNEFTGLLEDIAAEKARKERLKKGEPERHAGPMKAVQIEAYVCPAVGCADYYGHAGMPRLEEKWVGLKDINHTPKPVSEHRTRAACPSCRTRGVFVERVRVTTVAWVPEHVPATEKA